MKLTTEQLRSRVKTVADRIGEFTLENRLEEELTKIIEAATGEKIPEPFDESKVKHLSVWSLNGRPTYLLLEENCSIGCFYAIFIPEATVAAAIPAPRSTAKQMADRLRADSCTYLGQYDFDAGLPKTT